MTGSGGPGTGKPALAVWVAVLLAVVATGCTGGEPPSNGPVTAERQAADDALRSFRLDDPDARLSIERVRFTDAGVAAAADLLQSGATGDSLWAATYVYASWGEDPAPLRPLLQSDDPSIRVIAAAGLVSRGDESAFDVLVESLEHQETLAGSEPPQSIWSFAAFTLARYTGQELGPALDADESDVSAGHDRWAAWLDQRRDGLVFDEGSGTWSAA